MTPLRRPAAHAATDADVLTRTVELLSTADTLERVTDVVTAAVRTLMDADGATFVLREDDHCFYADEDAISPLWKGSRFPMTACISGWSMLHREVVAIPDIYADDRIPHDAYRPTFVASLCMAPVRSEAPIGALGAYWADSRTPTPQQVRLLQMVANSAAVAIENLELRGAVRRRSSERDEALARVGDLEDAIHTLVHDLRSPLGAMVGYAELAGDVAPTDPEKAQVFARTIVDSGARMAEQIERMLGLYRITQQPLAPATVDLSALGRDLAGELAARVPDRRVVVTVEDGLEVVADPVLTRLLLENLLGNAFKYTGKKPQAHIELGRHERDGGFSTFFVRDDGDGFHQEEAARLFRPMTRLHSDDDFPGTGLGLASVARIAERHGGRVRAEGAKSVGATFYVTLPVAS